MSSGTRLAAGLQASREQCCLATWPAGNQARRQAARTAAEAWGSARCFNTVYSPPSLPGIFWYTHNAIIIKTILNRIWQGLKNVLYTFKLARYQSICAPIIIGLFLPISINVISLPAQSISTKKSTIKNKTKRVQTPLRT